MIHHNVEVVDLYPLTWRNLGNVLRIDELASNRPAQHRTLSILHRAGKVLKVAQPHGVNASVEASVSDPQRVARELYEQFADNIDCVQIFDKDSLAAFSNSVQQLQWQKLTSGEFYLRAFELAQSTPDGIVFYPPTQVPAWNTLFRQAQYLIESVPDGQTLVMGIYDEGKPYFTLILKVEQQQITLCTTFEYLQPFGIDPAIVPSDATGEAQIIPLIEKHIGKVAHMLFCDRTTFEAWRDSLVHATSPLNVTPA